jgi:hypothetical protein
LVSEGILNHIAVCHLLVLAHAAAGVPPRPTCGVTVFLVEEPEWCKVVRARLDRADLLLDSNRRVPSCVPLPVPVPVPGAEPVQVRGNAASPLALHELPPEVYEHEWDMLMLDAPKG